MHPLIGRINHFANTNPVVRPVKWRLSDLVHRLFYHHVRRNGDKVRYQVHGMRRTGNHAIINWIIKGRAGNVIFCNDLDPGRHPATAPMKRLRRGPGEAAIITSYEDLPSAAFDREPHEAWYGRCKAVHHILILRDPFNLFASRFVWKRFRGDLFRDDPAHRAEVIATWKDHARTYLAWQQDGGQDGVFRHALNYNSWVADASYRNDMGRRLGLTSANEGLSEVTNYGGGSSFEGTNTSATDGLRYLQRFTKVIGDPAFAVIFRDRELVDLAQRIFGDIPRVDELLEHAERLAQDETRMGHGA